MQLKTSWLLTVISRQQLELDERSKRCEDAQDEIEYEYKMLGGTDV